MDIQGYDIRSRDEDPTYDNGPELQRAIDDGVVLQLPPGEFACSTLRPVGPGRIVGAPPPER